MGIQDGENSKAARVFSIVIGALSLSSGVVARPDQSQKYVGQERGQVTEGNSNFTCWMAGWVVILRKGGTKQQKKGSRSRLVGPGAEFGI